MLWDADEARKMRAAGAQWKQIAQRFGIDYHTVQARLDPEYAARRNAKKNYCRFRQRQGDEVLDPAARSMVRSVDDSEVARRLAEIPEDTRTPAQRLMGEPIFERSALYRRSPQ